MRTFTSRAVHFSTYPEYPQSELRELFPCGNEEEKARQSKANNATGKVFNSILHVTASFIQIDGFAWSKEKPLITI
ncbi:CLUMA_CG016893, isoform A [Clunio marinus]|uniref:CLUMA_CG016893, isoform A n=1 Tax=Clunio marinus TaxID=568069 RepID=A0A1J1ISC9_9DIPT|nr:CLUMA_CG016893, isoform A [Clunio marinus]